MKISLFKFSLLLVWWTLYYSLQKYKDALLGIWGNLYFKFAETVMNFLTFSELNVYTIYLICEGQIFMALPSCKNTWYWSRNNIILTYKVNFENSK